MAESNFQDAVELRSDTLAFKGEQLIVGTGTGNKSVVWSNDAAGLHLVGSPSADRTISLPDAGGTIALLTNIGLTALSAGTTRVTSGEVVFSNSQGLSFGVNGNTVTATADYVRSLSAGTTNATGNAIVFSNSNALSFGANGATITGSFNAIKSISAGTTRLTSGEAVFSDSQGISFGVNGNTITATADYVRSISAGTTNATGNAIVFSNGSGVTFGANGATITASVAGASAGLASLSAGTTRVTSGEVVFSDSNAISFGVNGNTVTASFNAIKSVSAGTTRITSGEAVWSNSNGVSFGVNGNTVTASTGTVLSYWQNPNVAMLTSWAGTSNSISIQRVYVPMNISATRADIVLSISGSSSGALSLRMNLGIYTASQSTLNSLSTTSRGLTFQSTSAISYTAVSRARSWSIGLGTWNFTPGEYFIAMNFGWTTASTNTVSLNMYGGQGTFPNVSGAETAALANITNYFRSGMINNNAQSTLPATMELSGMTQTGNSVGLQPWIAWHGTF